MTDRDRISRLEALLARVKARTEEPRPETLEGIDPVIETNGLNGHATHENGLHAEHPAYRESGQVEDEVAAVAQNDNLVRPDSVFPPESSTLHALPPPPPGSSASAFVAPESTPRLEEDFSDPVEADLGQRPISKPISSRAAKASSGPPSSLEEAFEQYELVQDVVEIAPDAEDDAVHPSVRSPILLDEVVEAEAAAAVRANEVSDPGFADADAPVEELQSQQRLVAAPSSRPVSGIDDTELEVLGEADLEGVMDVDTGDLLARSSQPDLESMGARSARQAQELISTILSTGIEPPPENANRPVLELQEEDDDELPPSSRRPVSHELPVASTSQIEVREQELIFDNDPPPLMTPPPESGRQVALPDLSPGSTNAFEASFSGLHEGSLGPSVLRADLDDNSGVAAVVAPSAPAAAATFGDLIDLALSI